MMGITEAPRPPPKKKSRVKVKKLILLINCDALDFNVD